MDNAEPCEFLPWDTEFFGHRIARVRGHRLTPRRTESIFEWCKTHAIECIYLLADSDDAKTVRLAEDGGFRFMDIRVTFERTIGDESDGFGINRSESITVRPAREGDIPALREIARNGYTSSRFYFDPRFSTEACEALYETWIKRSCEEYADVVLVAEVDDQPVGYVSCHLSGNEPRGQIGLVGVGPKARGTGVGQTLVNHTLHWFADRGVTVVRIVTQGRNIAAQRFYHRCGFSPHAVQLWYHKWLS